MVRAYERPQGTNCRGLGETPAVPSQDDHNERGDRSSPAASEGSGVHVASERSAQTREECRGMGVICRGRANRDAQSGGITCTAFDVD